MKGESDGAFIIDSSVVAAWAFRDEWMDYVLKVQDTLLDKGAQAPSLWPTEITNVLLQAQKRGRITQEDALDFLDQLASLPIQVEPPTPRSRLNRLYLIAQENRLTAYDAAYLILAMESNLPLATLDTDLLNAMEAVGVERFEP